MKAYDLSQIEHQHRKEAWPYLEFLRESSLSVGLYIIPTNGVDRQKPHTEDEIYYVISGQGVINVNNEDRPVASGSVIFVPAGTDHFFHIITEELKILVFFAPAEGSLRSKRR